jgi:hypothetical protein
MNTSVITVVLKSIHKFEDGELVLLFHAVFEVSARYCFKSDKIIIYNLLFCFISFTFVNHFCNDGWFERNFDCRKRNRKYRTKNDKIAINIINRTDLRDLFQKIIIIDKIEAVAE